MLPLIANCCNLGENTLDFTDCEKDLGVYISNNLNFNKYCNRIFNCRRLTKNLPYLLLRRTCCFVNDSIFKAKENFWEIMPSSDIVNLITQKQRQISKIAT